MQQQKRQTMIILQGSMVARNVARNYSVSAGRYWLSVTSLPLSLLKLATLSWAPRLCLTVFSPPIYNWSLYPSLCVPPPSLSLSLSLSLPFKLQSDFWCLHTTITFCISRRTVSLTVTVILPTCACPPLFYHSNVCIKQEAEQPVFKSFLQSEEGPGLRSQSLLLKIN